MRLSQTCGAELRRGHVDLVRDDGRRHRSDGDTVTYDITVGSLTGNWSGTINFGGNDNRATTLSLTQVGGVVSGLLTISPGSGAPRFDGRTDPAQLGRIDSNGAIEIRWKVDPFLDFTMRGQMDPTGTRISGGTFGSGFTGEPFVFDKR